MLKDSWPDTNSPREGEVLSMILADIGEDSETREFFLTIEAQGDVLIHGAVDRTLTDEQRIILRAQGDEEMFSLALTDYSRRALRKTESLYRSHQEEGRGSQACSHSETQNPAESLATYSSKTHHRIVFEEVCTSLNDEADLSIVFLTLHNVCGGALDSFVLSFLMLM